MRRNSQVPQQFSKTFDEHAKDRGKRVGEKKVLVQFGAVTRPK